ncbi:MAG: hypothetical protein GX286_01650 [Clostridiales bacterium]|jgi:spore cortex biosynthesis protein YabQ|nr:hypothetical protein [Clostridiales bacterium]
MELETFFTATEQTKLFLLSCLLGIPIGITFDIFRVIRAILPHNKIMVAIEDILFMFSYAAFVMCFSIVASRGEFRVFYIIGNILGFTVYFFSVGNIVVGTVRKIVLFIHKLLSKVFSPLRNKILLICAKIKEKFVERFKKN